MSESLVIREPGPGDLEAIEQLEKQCFADPWSAAVIDSELHASGRYHRVALAQNQIVGYLLAMWILDELHVNKLGVLPRFRRRGVGRELIDDCETFARSRGITTIRLEVRETNLTAINFYESLDYRAEYRRPGYYRGGEAAVVMIKEISARS